MGKWLSSMCKGFLKQQKISHAAFQRSVLSREDLFTILLITWVTKWLRWNKKKKNQMFDKLSGPDQNY